MILAIIKRAKKRVFKLARHIPSVSRKIQSELDKVEKQFEDEMSNFGKDMGYITVLPENSISAEEVMTKLDAYLKLGENEIFCYKIANINFLSTIF